MKFILFSLLIAAALSSNITINTDLRTFTDIYGRNLLFHGVNAVYKIPPYYPPNLETFDPLYSLCPEDFENLKSWGFNFIRLYMSWEGTELVEGVYNTSYIEQVREIVRTAAQYNITVLLDAHQDVLSRKFCGEGFPLWAFNRTNFPAPLNKEISYNSDGEANITECLQTPFSEYYITEDVQNAWETVYTNSDGLQNKLAAFWQTVAGYMMDEPNIIAYEIINEPFSADLYKNPLSVVDPQRDDVKFLEPFYSIVNDAIRKVDNNTIIFFEPIVNDIYAVAINKGPGGPAYNSKQALSYHVYCPDVDATGQPKSALVCHGLDTLFFNSKFGASTKIGVPGFLTEFGALSNTTESAAELAYITGLADAHLQSWSYWQFKYYNDITTAADPATTEGFYDVQGNLASVKVKALARSYMYATCGKPLSQSFDPASGKFVYTWEPHSDCKGMNSEFFLSKEYYYPNGFSASFTGCSQCQVVSLAPNYYQVVLTGGHSTQVTLTVVPSSSELEI